MASPEPPLAPEQKPAQRVGEAELAHESLALGKVGAGVGGARHVVPFGAVGGQLREPGVQLHLGRQHPDPLRQRQRLVVGLARAVHVGLRDLEVAAERRQRQDALAVVGAARELHRPLQVLARLLGVADAPEHASEDAVGAAGRPRLAEPLGQPQRLLRGVDREHVVPGVEVEPGRLLVEAHQLDPRRTVLEQVDAALVVLDGRPALALVRERGAGLAVEVRHPLEVLLAAVPVEALLPYPDGLVHAPEAQGHVAELLRHANAHGQVLVGRPRRARGGSGRRPRGSSRGARRRRRPPPGSASPARAWARARTPRSRPRGRATRRGRSARPAAPPSRRSGRPRAPR